jgi:hypothetical protein
VLVEQGQTHLGQAEVIPYLALLRLLAVVVEMETAQMALMVGLAAVAVLELLREVQEIRPLHLHRKATMEAVALVVMLAVEVAALVLLALLVAPMVEMAATELHLPYLAHL